MKQRFTKLLGATICALLLVPSSAKADATTLASWTFDTGYDVSENVYTPNANDWAAVGALWFKDGMPQFVANETIGTAADYILTGKTSRYWNLCVGYNNKVFRIVNDTEANSISDYTSSSQINNNYYEIQFPTTGYRNITIDYAISYGNNAAADIHAVYSIDNGNTWKESSVGYTGTHWSNYNNNTIVLNSDAKNQSKVLVRLVFGNGYSSNWNMDYLTIKGESISATPSTSTISFSAIGAEGVVPTNVSQAPSTSYLLPQNHSLYKEGYTLSGWSDGSNIYNIGESYIFTDDNTVLSAVFTENTVSLNDRTAAITVAWDFQTKNGAPTYNYGSNKQVIFVAQANIGGSMIDVKLDLDTKSAKIDNSNWTDWCQLNDGPTITIPAAKNMTINVTSLNNQTTTFAGSTDYTGYTSSNNVTFTYTGTEETIDIVVGGGTYYRTVTAVYPAPQTVDVTISSALYATYYNSALALTVPANLQAATVDGESGGALTLNWRYNEGDVIPAGTPVLLKATTANTYTLTEKIGDATAVPAGNLLYGSDTETTTTGGGDGAKYYALQYGTGENASVLGFYWMADDGAAFTSGAHKAWLALPAATLAPFFTLDGGETTSISEELRMKSEEYN